MDRGVCCCRGACHRCELCPGACGDAQNGWVRDFILDQGGNPNTRTGSGPEFGTVDKFGNIFAGEPRPRVLRKYVKVR